MASQAPAQVQSDMANVEIAGQYLAIILSTYRAAFYEQKLLQQEPIHISSSGSISQLEGHPRLMEELTFPSNAQDTPRWKQLKFSPHATNSPYRVDIIPNFVAWRVGTYFRQCDLITRLILLFEPPGGSNYRLMPLLSIGNLRSVRFSLTTGKLRGWALVVSQA